MSADRQAFVDRLIRQMQAFDTITVECSRCHRQARLASLIPTARGLHCERCLVGMSSREFREVNGENDALAAVARRLGGT